MDKLVSILKSRTVWATIAMFIINGIPMIHNLIPAAWVPLVDAINGLLIVYFRITPKQTFDPQV